MGAVDVEQAIGRRVVVFQSPFQIGVNRERLAPPRPEEVVVRVEFSAISAGTELLAYRGQLPDDVPLDAGLPALSKTVAYPLRYGYAAVGAVIATGSRVSPAWVGRRVFCFHPHASHLLARPEDTVPIPEDVTSRDAVFLANMETAVTLILDGRPTIGGLAVVFGQGVVGLLATALLSRHPLKRLFTVDPVSRRRKASLDAGADAVFAPKELEALQDRLTADSDGALADVVFELSGDPQSLNDAVSVAGFGARIVIGSWYGTKTADIRLGGRFHRSRIRLISSQVSSLPSELSARWSPARRIAVAWDMIRSVQPSRFITHEIPVEQAVEAYELLDLRPAETLQAVLTYGE
jgi:2-desacetyl-2-hydroxyethyl bacteriochlorophyllide A dehydrogenase